ncbi:putative uncharacterized protein DDB_G0270496 [Copidosoma floridanum]|uniref:putative uncharacterized protein DDB_G0270496 n=1 Tax=Copidosoma floridanum TaxID=29053 RepID=UPI000C6F79E4|nr:putative uncharacterized protein DDB_G0270496 [Copidosoma floridanum]
MRDRVHDKMPNYSSSSSSSSSSSDDGGSASSSSTGRFSSAESFCSTSTIVPPEPCPFGKPNYNYFWIENRSRSNPKLSYYYNYKSHAVVWTRPVSKNTPLPFYSSWVSMINAILSQNDEDAPVSDFEDEIQTKKRLAIKRRNKRLVAEDLEDDIEVLTVKKAIKSRRMLETFWKLHRFPGETLKDVKKRLLETSETAVPIKKEVADDGYDTQNSFNVSIKKEPNFEENNDTCATVELNVPDESNQPDVCEVIAQVDEPATNEDSDSDTENVSRLIKEEYLNTYGSTDDESKDDIDEDNEDDEDDTEDQQSFAGKEILAEDFLEVVIHEEDEEKNDNFYTPDNSMANDNLAEDQVNWTFEKSSESINNSSLTMSAINTVYRVPEMKRFEKEYLLNLHKKKKLMKKAAEKKVPKLLIKLSPECHIQKDAALDPDQPVVCDMYGTRTFNYNSLPRVKIPKWQAYSRLSDSDTSSEEELRGFEKQVPNSLKLNPFRTAEAEENFSANVKEAGALELRNWFPSSRKTKKRKRRSKSDSSWCESNISEYSEIDDVDVTLVKLKKEKNKSSSNKDTSNSDEEEENEKNEVEALNVVGSIKQEKMDDCDEDEGTQETCKVPDKVKESTAVSDMIIVKVERRSSESLEVENPAIEPRTISEELEVENVCEADEEKASSSSSSSSCCSRSSCSCSSSSSSSSSSDEEETNANDNQPPAPTKEDT